MELVRGTLHHVRRGELEVLYRVGTGMRGKNAL